MSGTQIRWPLLENVILRGKIGTFGAVRDGGKRAHYGWDLYATPGTICLAVDDGVVTRREYSSSYGNVVDVKLNTKINGQPVFARYAHLSSFMVHYGQNVAKGGIIGYTGNTGNAKTMKGLNQHLHFELMAKGRPASGLAGLAWGQRYNPADIYGIAPLNQRVYDCWSQLIGIK